jgi:Flp pilus assembly protein TadG
MMLRFLSSASALFRDARGSVQTIAGLAVPVIAIGIAGAVEFTDVVRTRGQLQAIADSTALNGARQYGVDPSAATLARIGAWADSLTAPLEANWSIQTSVTADKNAGSVTVAMSATRASYFGKLLPSGSMATEVSATGVNAATYPLCALALQPGGPGLGLQGAAKLTAQDCLVQSNGDMMAGGASTVKAGAARAAGRASGDIAPTPVMDAPEIRDPFAALPIKVPAGCSDITLQLGSGTRTLNPGVHCGNIQLLGNGTLQLNPGEHYFVGPLFSLAGNVTIQGSDVVVIFKDQLGIDITGNVTLSIEARKAGPYAGFALITDRSFQGTLALSAKNAKKILGTIYLPNGELAVAGAGNRIADQSPWTIVVARRFTATGSPTLVINSAYASTDTPVPTGVGPGAVRLQN